MSEREKEIKNRVVKSRFVPWNRMVLRSYHLRLENENDNENENESQEIRGEVLEYPRWHCVPLVWQ